MGTIIGMTHIKTIYSFSPCVWTPFH